ncbi:MAG: ATP-dependent DNA helicase [Deltaproteobacteria bacterium]|jgi:ATP-dependent DNA helicase DinG|nr:ATP-dependent DNA helicase [Deltaproteobacteria bacterium]
MDAANIHKKIPAKKHILPAGLPANLEELEYLLTQEGPLGRSWEGFESREAQQRMFRETLEAFKNGTTSVIEAGTGTGKTLAYLLPAIISGKKTFVSTGLKNLQEQINTKDLEFIREHFNTKFKAVVLKGRQNYLCQKQLQTIETRLSNSLDRDIRNFVKLLRSWASETQTGEIDELNAFDMVMRLEPPFDRLHSTSESCMGRLCPHNEKCFVTQIRKKAAEADLVLINHHLFMADLSLRRNQDFTGFLPEWEAVVIDEAHLLLDVACNYFSYKLSTKSLLNAILYLQQVISWEMGKDRDLAPDYEKTLNQIRKVSDAIEEDVLRISNRYGKTQEEDFLWPDIEEDLWDKDSQDFKKLLNRLSKNLSYTTSAVKDILDKGEDFKAVYSDLAPSEEALGFISRYDNKEYVYQVKSDSDSVELAALPIDVSPFLEQYLFKGNKTTILCSATLSAYGSLDYFKKKTGIKTESSSLILSSPFDYTKNARFYIPNSMLPPPEVGESDVEYNKALVEQILKLLEITEGRALVLFTSFRQMNMVKEAIAKIPDKKYKVFSQEPGMGRTQLLNDFRSDYSSVLLATHSFWQGVDIRGQSLSAVIIDKIPFPRPNTPLSKAKEAFIKRNNGNAFNEYSVPEATLSLKQGIGRLLRTKTDWGLLSILDSRLHHRRYGPQIYKDLNMPPRILIGRLSDVEKFFNEKNAQF